MKSLILLALAAATLFALSGCGEPETPPSSNPPSAGKKAGGPPGATFD